MRPEGSAEHGAGVALCPTLPSVHAVPDAQGPAATAPFAVRSTCVTAACAAGRSILRHCLGVVRPREGRGTSWTRAGSCREVPRLVVFKGDRGEGACAVRGLAASRGGGWGREAGPRGFARVRMPFVSVPRGRRVLGGWSGQNAGLCPGPRGAHTLVQWNGSWGWGGSRFSRKDTTRELHVCSQS